MIQVNPSAIGKASQIVMLGNAIGSKISNGIKSRILLLSTINTERRIRLIAWKYSAITKLKPKKI